MPRRFVYSLGGWRTPNTIGNKARNLRRLQRKKFRVPDSWVCTWDAYFEYDRNPSQTIERVSNEVAKVLDPEDKYAVRSSANIEDDISYSFAGQFKTHLAVRDAGGVMAAIQDIWETSRSEQIQAYLAHHDTHNKAISMAVLIQKMVTPCISGVVFSKNPLTGLDEIVVEAVEGAGTSLVQDGVSPRRWLYKWGAWLEQPDDEVIPRELIAAVIERTKAITQSLGNKLDLEWVYDGRHIYWVQLREITSMKNVKIYSNRISKEVLPGMIKPLVWSINVPLTVRQWANLIEEFVGPNAIDEKSLAHAFYYRAYFEISSFSQIFSELGIPPESLELLMGMLPPQSTKPAFKPGLRALRKLPRLLRFTLDKWTLAPQLEKDLPLYKTAYQALFEQPLDHLTLAEIYELIDHLRTRHARITYLTIIVPLIMNLYQSLWKRYLTTLGVDFMHFDLTNEMPRISAYDPTPHLRTLNRKFNQLNTADQRRLRSEGTAALDKTTSAADFSAQFKQFMAQFGHLSDKGTDFSHPPWREDPDLILELVASYPKQPATIDQRVTFADLQLSGLQRIIAQILYPRARKFQLYREMTSSLYTYGLGLFRTYYLAIGERLVKQGLLARREDVFFLYDREIRAINMGVGGGDELRHKAANRQNAMQRYSDARLPEIIYGTDPPPLLDAVRHRLAGTPTSRGYYTGPARVILSLADFPKLQGGDVLVIPYSDVGWTPLFVKAGAVIAESGGMLSHSSIIAREYGIPAVVSVSGALELTDDTLVSVDGYKGEVIVCRA